MHRLARRAVVPVLLLVVVALAAACTPLNSQEQYLFDHTNDLRTKNGLGILWENEALTAKARSWAATLASQGKLAHEDLHSLGMTWVAAGENVGKSSSIEDLVQRLDASPEHRANMLNPTYLIIGIGTARGRDGSVYAVQLFMRQ